MRDCGDGDRDGVDQLEHLAEVARAMVPHRGGHGLCLLGTGVGHGHQLDAGHRRQYPSMMLAQMADSHDADSEPLSSRPPAFPGPAVLAQMLALDEGSSRLRTSGQTMTVRFEDFRRMVGSHPGAIEQPMSLVQAGDGLGADAITLQAHHVEAAHLGRIAVNHHEPGHVMVDTRQAPT